MRCPNCGCRLRRVVLDYDDDGYPIEAWICDCCGEVYE